MAGRSPSHGGVKHVHRLLASPGGGDRTCGAGEEFDESDVWSLLPEPRPAEPRKPARAAARRKAEHVPPAPAPATAAGSLPVNIPDWSKILGREYRSGSNRFAEAEEEEGEWTGAVIPPHELLFRNRTASFSVHEGIGRTLKGRDLSRVRDAVWEQTGFQA